MSHFPQLLADADNYNWKTNWKLINHVANKLHNAQVQLVTS